MLLSFSVSSCGLCAALWFIFPSCCWVELKMWVFNVSRSLWHHHLNFLQLQRDEKQIRWFKVYCVLQVTIGSCLVFDSIIGVHVSWRNPSKAPKINSIIFRYVYLLLHVFILVCVHLLERKFEREKFPRLVLTSLWRKKIFDSWFMLNLLNSYLIDQTYTEIMISTQKIVHNTIS